MSIASYSVVGRILAEVGQVAPFTPLARLSSVKQVSGLDQVFELRRTRRIHETPFAIHGLCERVDSETVASGFAELGLRMSDGIDVGDLVGLRLGYRMIDQDVMASWVAEADGEQVAVFWARPAWMAGAAPIQSAR
jgi:hypothetical protein